MAKPLPLQKCAVILRNTGTLRPRRVVRHIGGMMPAQAHPESRGCGAGMQDYQNCA